MSRLMVLVFVSLLFVVGRPLTAHAQSIQVFCTQTPVNTLDLDVMVFIETSDYAGYRDPFSNDGIPPFRFKFTEMLSDMLYVDNLIRGMNHRLRIYTYTDVPTHLSAIQLDSLYPDSIASLRNYWSLVETKRVNFERLFNEIGEHLRSIEENKSGRQPLVIVLNDMMPNGYEDEGNFASLAYEMWRESPAEELGAYFYMIDLETNRGYTDRQAAQRVFNAWKTDFFIRPDVRGSLRVFDSDDYLYQLQYTLEEVTGSWPFHSLNSRVFDSSFQSECPFAETSKVAAIFDEPNSDRVGTTTYSIIQDDTGLDNFLALLNKDQTTRDSQKALYAVATTGGLQQITCPPAYVAGGDDIEISLQGNILNYSDFQWEPADPRLPTQPLRADINTNSWKLGPLPAVEADTPLDLILYEGPEWREPIACKMTLVPMPTLRISDLEVDQETQQILITVAVSNYAKMGEQDPFTTIQFGKNALPEQAGPPAHEDSADGITRFYKYSQPYSGEDVLDSVLFTATLIGKTVDHLPVDIRVLYELETMDIPVLAVTPTTSPTLLPPPPTTAPDCSIPGNCRIVPQDPPIAVIVLIAIGIIFLAVLVIISTS